jgi:hypothetical protein
MAGSMPGHGALRPVYVVFMPASRKLAVCKPKASAKARRWAAFVRQYCRSCDAGQATCDAAIKRCLMACLSRRGSARLLQTERCRRALCKPAQHPRCSKIRFSVQSRRRAPGEYPPVADEIIGLREFVIKPPRRIVRPGVPIKPRPAIRLGTIEQVTDQHPPDPMAARFWRDEQIFEMADRRDRPR